MHNAQKHITPLGNYNVPTGWPMKPYKRPYGGTPGPPVMYEKPSDPEEENAGYGYSNAEGLEENDIYFYHPDHLGSSSFITNTEGEVVQHIEYVPYGEVFIEERNNVWNTPYLFNAKEFDEETGLYYYGARYYDSRLAMWYGVDALAEKYPNMGGYVYCAGNPVKLVDVDGNEWGITTNDDGVTCIHLSMNLSSDANTSSDYINSVKSSMRCEFNRLLSDATGGMVVGDVDFNEAEASIIQTMGLSSTMDGVIGGITSEFSSAVNVVDVNGQVRPVSDVVDDMIHEALHTLRVPHPFEETISEDTELVKCGPNQFRSTTKTNRDIVNNIMSYKKISIDGKTKGNVSSLTKGQVEFMIGQIKLQQQGYGFRPKYNKSLTAEENESIMQRKYINYWYVENVGKSVR